MCVGFLGLGQFFDGSFYFVYSISGAFFCCVHWMKIVLTRIHRFIKRFDCDFHLVVFWSHQNWLIRMRFSRENFWFSIFCAESLNWNEVEISSAKWFEANKNREQSNFVRFSKECMVNLRQVHFRLRTMDLFHSLLFIENRKVIWILFLHFDTPSTFHFTSRAVSNKDKKQHSIVKKNEKRSNFQCQKLSGTMNCVRILAKQRSHSVISLSLCRTTHPIFFLRDAFISNLYDKTHINAYTNVCVCAFKDQQISDEQIHWNQFNSGRCCCCLCAGKLFVVYGTKTKQILFFTRVFFSSSLHLNEKDKTETPLSLCSVLLAFESSVRRFCCCAKRNRTKKQAAKAIYKSE